MILKMILLAALAAASIYLIVRGARMRGAHLNVGDRVQTPNGPGVIKGFIHNGLVCAVEHDEESVTFHRLQSHEQYGLMPIKRRAGYFYAPQLLKRIK